MFTFGLLLRAVSVGALPFVEKLWVVNLLTVVQGATLPWIGITIRVCLVRAVGRHRTAQALNFTIGAIGAFGLASIVTSLLYSACQKKFGDANGFRVAFFAVAGATVALAVLLQNFATHMVEEEEAEALGGSIGSIGNGMGNDSARESGVSSSNFSFWNEDELGGIPPTHGNVDGSPPPTKHSFHDSTSFV